MIARIFITAVVGVVLSGSVSAAEALSRRSGLAAFSVAW